MTTSKAGYRAGYQPLPAGIFVAPFPNPLRFGGDVEAATDHCLAALRHLLVSQTAPSETAAIVIEPVLGEGGYVAAPVRFLPGSDGDLPRARHPVRCRRDPDRLRPHRAHVRRRALTGAPGRPADGEGDRPCPASRSRPSAPPRRSWAAGPRAPTAAPTAATRSAARPRWPPSTCSPSPGSSRTSRPAGSSCATGLAKLAAEDHGVAEVRGLGLMVAVEFADPATGQPDGAEWRRPAPLPDRGAPDPHERRQLRQHHPLHAAPGRLRGRDRGSLEAFAAALKKTRR